MRYQQRRERRCRIRVIGRWLERLESLCVGVEWRRQRQSSQMAESPWWCVLSLYLKPAAKAVDSRDRPWGSREPDVDGVAMTASGVSVEASASCSCGRSYTWTDARGRASGWLSMKAPRPTRRQRNGAPHSSLSVVGSSSCRFTTATRRRLIQDDDVWPIAVVNGILKSRNAFAANEKSVKLKPWTNHNA